MKKAALKMLPALFWLGIFISFSSLLWLGIYLTVDAADALLLMASVLLCAAVQVAAWYGGRRYPTAPFWLAGCMLLAGPATFWSAWAGPSALMGNLVDLYDMSISDAKPPFFYIMVPMLVVGLVVGILWLVAGLMALSQDVLDRTAKGAAPGGKPARRAKPGPAPAGDAMLDALVDGTTLPPPQPAAVTPGGEDTAIDDGADDAPPQTEPASTPAKPSADESPAPTPPAPPPVEEPTETPVEQPAEKKPKPKVPGLKLPKLPRPKLTVLSRFGGPKNDPAGDGASPEKTEEDPTENREVPK